ncbi:MAG: extracellular solute-binding protein [Clostridiales bacterium]|nr:extracellular solute-binding protein [Clostridiales bacterium]
MKNNKAIKLIICIFICALILMGCSNRDSEYVLNQKDSIVIDIWHYYNGPLKVLFDEKIKEFNETVGYEKGIIVEAFSQGNINDLERKVMESINKKIGAEKPPNMFTAYGDTAYEIDKLGLLVDLDQYLTEDEKSEYIVSYIQEGYFDDTGGLKIFPIAKATEIMMLNKTDWDKFASETGADLEDLKTWEGVARTAKKYYEWTNSKYNDINKGKSFFGRDAIANYIIVGAKQLGVEIFNVENGICTLNLDEKVMYRLWENFYIPYINGYYNSVGKFRTDDIRTGEIIALVGSTSGIGYFPERVIINDEIEYDIESIVLPLPNFENTPAHAVQQGAGMAVLKSDKASEYASVEFLKWFTGKETNIEFSIKTGYLPVKKESNKLDVILGYIHKDIDDRTMVQLKKFLPVVTEQLKTYELHTNRPFKNGADARAVLTEHLIQRCKEDRNKVLDLIDNGYTREEVIAEFDNYDNFYNWFTDLKRELEKAIN